MLANCKKLLVAFGDSTCGNLKFGIEDREHEKWKQDYEVILLHYYAEFGDITNLPFSQERFYREMYFVEAESAYEENQKNIKQLHSINKETEVELFVNPNWANDLCNLYCFAKEFEGFTNLYLTYFHEEERESHLGVFYSVIVIDKRIVLSDNDLKEYIKKWEILSKNKEDIRICRDGEIVELPLQDAKDMVLSVMTTEYRKFPLIFTDVIKKYDDEREYITLSYNGFEYIMQKLIDEKIVKRTKNKNVQSGCPDIFFEQKFRLIKS